jgi:glutathione S-transferase
MLKLYQTAISFNSRRVWITLLEKGLDFQLEEVQLNGQQFQPEFLALNPFHHIPVLVDGDLTVIESLAILDYLEAKYPQPRMLPADPTDLAKVRMVEMVTVNELAPAMMPLYPKILGLGEGDPALIAEAMPKITTNLQFLEGLLDDRSFFGSDTITLAEPVAGTIIAYLGLAGIELNKFPKLNAWLERLICRSSWLSTEASVAQMDALKKMMIDRSNRANGDRTSKAPQ